MNNDNGGDEADEKKVDDNKVKAKIIEKSNGLFLYASKSFEKWMKYIPKSKSELYNSIPSDLFEVYKTFIERGINYASSLESNLTIIESDSKFKMKKLLNEQICMIMSVMAMAKQPLSKYHLQQMICMMSSVESSVGKTEGEKKKYCDISCQLLESSLSILDPFLSKISHTWNSNIEANSIEFKTNKFNFSHFYVFFHLSFEEWIQSLSSSSANIMSSNN